MQLTKLFSMYIEERTFLKNASPLSIKSNKINWLRFEKVMGEKRLLKELDELFLKEFVIGLKNTGLSPTICSIAIRELNTFLKWLFDNEFTPTQSKRQRLRTEKTIQKDFTGEDIKKFVNWHPGFDNIFVERLWRTVKQEEVYLKEYLDVRETEESLRQYYEFYSYQRPHTIIRISDTL